MKVSSVLCAGTLLVGLVWSCTSSRDLCPEESTHLIRKGILNGQIGTKYALRAHEAKDLHIEPLPVDHFPFPLYLVYDTTSAYTVLKDTKGLVLLCDDFGGGRAQNFSKRPGEGLWDYEYTAGSGTTYFMRGVFDVVKRVATWEGHEDYLRRMLNQKPSTEWDEEPPKPFPFNNRAPFN